MKIILKLMLVIIPSLLILSYGENWNTTLNPEDLQIPVAPAFVLLGIEPTSIEQPKTPRAFVLNLLNARANTDFIPKDYAMEVAPYWLISHPSLTFNDYYQANIIQTITQTTNLSVATIKSSLDSLQAGTSLGLGLSAMLLQGEAHPKLKDLKSKLDSILISMAVTEDSIQYELLRDSARSTALEIQQMDKQRMGLRIEFAGGSIIDFAMDNFEYAKITGYGIWILPAYKLSKTTLDFIALGRYLHNERDSVANYFDFGGRIVSESADFILSGEFVYRMVNHQNNKNNITYRSNVSVEYQLNPNIRIIGSFGKNFKTNERDLIASFGVNLGFGSIPILKL